MPELDLREKAGIPGCPFESPHLHLEIYRLVATVGASGALVTKANESNDPGWGWLKRVEMAELSRLLVSIAAITRNNIDAYPNYDDSTFCRESRRGADSKFDGARESENP